MRLVIREYLEMLRESREFDALLPDLLLAMKIVPLSKAQIGVRQAGVDIAAVGFDENDKKTLWLFVVKCGDLGRREWDSQSQSVRQSLDEIKDIYLRNNVAPEHASLPVKIIVATTGDFKQDFEQNRVGYAEANEIPGRTYEFWNGDRFATLIEQYLLNEYVLPPEARSQLRRTLALIGEPDYDLEHYFAMLKMLLWNPTASRGKSNKQQNCLRSIVTTSLALAIVCRWAGQEGNLRNALIASERTLLWTWDSIRSSNLAKKKSVFSGYVRLVNLYLGIAADYFNKVQPHLHIKDAIGIYYREASLMTERVFEEIGAVATIGLAHLFWGLATRNDNHLEGAGVIANSLNAFLKSHRCSGSPCYDGQITDVSLGLLLLISTERGDNAKEWLRELTGRITYGFQASRWFPISTDSFDDLVAVNINGNEVDADRLKETSWMLPILAQWSAVLGEDVAYQQILQLQNDLLAKSCFQIWYPDEKTDEVMYREAAHFETGTTEAPIIIPESMVEMLANIKKLRGTSPVGKRILSSATVAGLPWLDFIASRHFRTPLDPILWQHFAMNEDADKKVDNPQPRKSAKRAKTTTAKR